MTELQQSLTLERESFGPQMTSVTINLSDEHAAELKQKAMAQGLTLEGWLQKLADQEAPLDKTARARAAADRIVAIQKRTKPDPEGWTIRDYIDNGRR
jgi:hypothetical protein